MSYFNIYDLRSHRQGKDYLSKSTLDYLSTEHWSDMHTDSIAISNIILDNLYVYDINSRILRIFFNFTLVCCTSYRSSYKLTRY